MSSVRSLGFGVEIFIGNHNFELFTPKKRYTPLFYYIVLNIFISIQEVTSLHTVLSCQLEFVYLEHIVACRDIKHAFIDDNSTRTHTHVLLCLCSLEDLQVNALAVGSKQGGPGTRIRTESTDEVIETLRRTAPVDLTDILKKFTAV